jgi:hypothetical protein
MVAVAKIGLAYPDRNDRNELAQRPDQADVRKSRDKLGLRTHEVTLRREGRPALKVELVTLPVEISTKLRLLTKADLPAAYSRDATPLAASEWLSASQAAFVVSVGSFEDTRSGTRISQGFVKSQFTIRVRPRKFRPGTRMKPSHFMDSVVCIDQSGNIESLYSAPWSDLDDWYSKTDSYRDCIEVGPMCGFRRKSATHSDLKPATDSDLKSATCSDPSRPPIPI